MHIQSEKLSPSEPLQVYLDSSDYSDMAAKTGGDPQGEALSYLRLRKHEGLVQFRYSAATVLEGLATTPEHLSKSEARFALIQELCGGNCLADPSSLIRGELSGAFKRDGRRHAYRHGGQWLPGFESVNIELPSMLVALNDALRSSNANQRVRRQAHAQFLDSNGRLTKLGEQKFLAMHPQVLEDLVKRYPLNEETIKLALDVMAGRAERERFSKAIQETLTTLTLFHELPKKRWEEVSGPMGWLRARGSQMADAMNRHREVMIEKVASFRQSGRSDDELEKVVARIAKEQPAKMAMAIASTSADKLGAAPVEPSWEATPGLFVMVHLSSSLMRATLSPTNPRNPRGSDLGDIQHAAYVPYVDLFRGDAYTCDQLRPLNLPPGTTLVSKLTALPAAIDAALKRIQQ